MAFKICVVYLKGKTKQEKVVSLEHNENPLKANTTH